MNTNSFQLFIKTIHNLTVEYAREYDSLDILRMFLLRNYDNQFLVYSSFKLYTVKFISYKCYQFPVQNIICTQMCCLLKFI